MEPNTLRTKIIRRVREHQVQGTSAYMEDQALAAAIGEPLTDVQHQLRILQPNVC
jgi:hypothetical protein